MARNFIGGIAESWLKNNIIRGFGREPNKTYSYIARVLEVYTNDPEPGNPAYSVPYRIRCRLLSPMGQFAARHPDALKLPDSQFPDPCDFLSAEANAAIQRHPWYYPVDQKLKKPYVGDIVQVTRVEGTVLTREFKYLGFLVKSPVLSLLARDVFMLML